MNLKSFFAKNDMASLSHPHTPGYVIYQKCSSCSSVVRSSDGPERFFPAWKKTSSMAYEYVQCNLEIQWLTEATECDEGDCLNIWMYKLMNSEQNNKKKNLH